MRFKLDENLPDTCAELLRREGLDVAIVREQQLGGAPDSVVHSVCHSEGRVLVTLDLDFADIREYRQLEDRGSSCSGCRPKTWRR